VYNSLWAIFHTPDGIPECNWVYIVSKMAV
jgi:hypothetical protein